MSYSAGVLLNTSIKGICLWFFILSEKQNSIQEEIMLMVENMMLVSEI
jgi:hypothetical protein